jgi:enoyl-[acyl-carrier protein] reductase II
VKKTRICDLLSIEYPIIQGGMTWIANAELAAAVSEAGGLGIISANAGWDAKGELRENLRRQIRLARELTANPFGVNITVMDPSSRVLVEVVVEEKVPVVTTSAGNPATYTSFFKEHEVKVLHVIAEGYEAGGHNGLDELPTFVLLPQVVDALKVPVVAAGGIADARGFVAALALGAEGVQIGTRFVATKECCAHPGYKQTVLEALDTGTVITGRKIGPTRGLRNAFTARMQELEAQGASGEEMETFIGWGRTRAGQLEGDLEQGELYCGAIAGSIREITGAGDVVRSIVSSAEEVLARLR